VIISSEYKSLLRHSRVWVKTKEKFKEIFVIARRYEFASKKMSKASGLNWSG
jgi:hypothetical protein